VSGTDDWAPGAYEHFMEAQSRPENRLTYLGATAERTSWAIDIFVHEGDGWCRKDPDTGEDVPDEAVEPGSYVRLGYHYHITPGPETYFLITLRAFIGQELRAEPELQAELAALLRAAADDTTWESGPVGASPLTLSVSSRETVRALADEIEREGHARLGPPHATPFALPIPLTSPFRAKPEPGEAGSPQAEPRFVVLEYLGPPRSSTRSRGPDIPHVFRGGEAPVPASLAIQGALASYRAGPAHWQPTPEGLPTFLYHQPQGGLSVFFRPPTDATLSPALAESLWSQVQQLTDLDGDVLLAAMAQALEGTGQTSDGSAWITADRILDYRGIKPKTKREGRAVYRAGHRREDLADIAACFDRFTSTWVELQEVAYRKQTGSGRKVEHGRLTLESPLIIVDERAVQHEMGASRLPVAWRYRLGRCVREYLDGPNRQVAGLLQQALQYDPYRERWEKRLALYFMFHLRMDQKQRGPLRRPIGKLLQDLNLPLDDRNPQRCRARFETAMNRVTQDGCIGGWAYADPPQAKAKVMPARGWLPTWLALKIDVQRPAARVGAGGRA
jgi:hypothetical protein